ncbi:MAG TPA: hemolysin III family protein [Acidimicrobiia bacterium]|nr:hemolysin III family protein [Acidimicrobiia bacterium]
MREPEILQPLLRGRLHQIACLVSIPAGVALVTLSRGVAAHVGAAIFAASLTLLFGTSAAYHCGKWTPRARRVMQRLDHSMIYVLIAGTYTPFTLLALRPAWGVTLLAIVWTGAVVGVLLTVLASPRLRWVGMGLYVILGWLVIVAAPQLMRDLTHVELGLLAGGGVLYTAGLAVLVRNRPNPRPRVFGYHELWHAMGIVAAVCHYAVILLLVRA